MVLSLLMRSLKSISMLLTADHDDRVVPLHSLKLLMTTRHVLCTSMENNTPTDPIFGHINPKAGHRAGMPTSKIANYTVEDRCWLVAFSPVLLRLGLRRR